METSSFFASHPVFRREEFVEYLSGQGQCNSNTLKALLQYHLASGHISHIRRGYYAVTSALKSQGAVADDSFLIAGRIMPDAVIAYHAALSFHGLAYSLFNVFYYCSRTPVQAFQFAE